MSDFGDFDEDDAFDPNEPADPEQVARKLHALRRTRGLESTTWDELTDQARAVRVAVIVALLLWLRRQGTG